MQDELWKTLAPLAASLAVLGGGLMAWHLRTWRRLAAAELAPREHDFARRQFRRRMQTSGMLVVLGIALVLGCWIRSPLLTLFYWAGVAFWTLWICLLAAADAAASRYHFALAQRDVLLEQLKLQTRLRQTEGDDKPPQPR